MFNTYASIMASQPTLFQNETLTTMSAVMGPVGAGLQTFNSVSNLIGNWNGSGQQAQSSQASGYLAQGQQIVTAFTQGQQIINAGAQQLQNAKARLVALTNAAKGQGFIVTPAGTVLLGKPHYLKINAARAKWGEGAARAVQAAFEGTARGYEAQFNLVVLQTNMADAQVALTLANSAVSVLGSLTQKDAGAETPPQTGPSPVGPNPVTGASPTAPVSAGALPTLGTGTALAGAGSFGGVGAAGLGLPGAAGVNPATLGGTAGVTPGLAGGGGVPPGSATPGGAGMMPGMMYGGGMAGGHLSEKEHREGSEWLEEDGEPWQTADAANDAGGVLS
jgi:hypothetical protein